MAIIKPGEEPNPPRPSPEPGNTPAPAKPNAKPPARHRFAARRVHRAFVRRSMAQVGLSASVVWFALLAYVDPLTAEVAMGITQISKLTGLKPRTVKAAKKRLTDLGLLVTVHRGNTCCKNPDQPQHGRVGVYQLRGVIRGQP